MTTLPVGAYVCAMVVGMKRRANDLYPGPSRVRFPLHQSPTLKSVGFFHGLLGTVHRLGNEQHVLASLLLS